MSSNGVGTPMPDARRTQRSHWGIRVVIILIALILSIVLILFFFTSGSAR